ncbi:CPBP family intramembrane metalloprotease [Bacillus cereus]|nr:CPBP family intramembrane metalloprotease [Bacillus cereus]
MILNYFIYTLFFASTKVGLYLIKKIRGSLFLDVVRSLLFFIPFCIPMLYYGIPSLKFDANLICYGMAITGSIIALMFQFKEYKAFLNRDFYDLLPPLSLKSFLIEEYSLIASCFFEEIFYRFYLPKSMLEIELLASGIFFTVAHFIQGYTRKRFSIKSYIIIFFLSIIWYLSYKLSGSIWPAVIGHFFYNLPTMLITCARFYFSNFQKENCRENSL